MAANVVKLDHMQMRKIEDGLDNIAKALNRIAKAAEKGEVAYNISVNPGMNLPERVVFPNFEGEPTQPDPEACSHCGEIGHRIEAHF